MMPIDADYSDDEGNVETEHKSWFEEAMNVGQNSSGTRSIFVIMPFLIANERTELELDHLFEDSLRAPLEAYSGLEGVRFKVERSQSKLRIHQEMHKDIAIADYAIVDLSGPHSNPNVMYELGVRLAISTKPVILIREKHPDNRPIFDVSGLHTFLYDPRQLDQLTQYIINKITAFENAEEQYVSPVLESIKQGLPFDENYIRQRAIDRLKGLSGLLEEYVVQVGNVSQRALTHLGIELKEYKTIVGSPPLAAPIDAALLSDVRAAEKVVSQLVKPPRGFSVESILTDSFLSDVLPQKLAKQFMLALRSYYVQYFGLHTYWQINPPILASMGFAKATLQILQIIKYACSLIDMGYTGPLDVDETTKGVVPLDHMEFAFALQLYQNDLNSSWNELFGYIDRALPDKRASRNE